MRQIIKLTTGIRSKLIIKIYKKWLKKNEKVLDIGCGDGILSSIIIKNTNINLTGCDVSNYLKIKIPFVMMKDTEKLPFKDKSFDTVMLNDVLHHISFINQENILKESVRVAEKIMIFEVEPTLIGKLSDFMINKFHSIGMPVPLTFRNKTDWQKLFEKLNVKTHYIKPGRPFLYPFKHQAFLLTSINEKK